MTTRSTFSDFAARLREFIRTYSGLDCPCIDPHASERSENRPDNNASSNREFNRLALELFALQFHHNAPFRRLCQTRRVSPETISDWGEIPAVPTAAFQEVDLTSLMPREQTAVFHSSGTTDRRPS